MTPLVFMTILVVLISILQHFFRKPKNFPPGPWGLPVVGYALFVNKTKIYETFEHLQARYGSVVSLRLGLNRAVVISGWKAVHEALMNEDLNYRPRVIVSIELYPGQQRGVLLNNGEAWKEQRRFTLHQLRNLGFGKRSHESVIEEEAVYLVQQLLKHENEPVDVKVPLGVSSINILWTIMGGKRHEHSDPVLQRLVAYLNRGMRAGAITGGLMNGFPFLRHIAPDYFGYTEIRQAFADIKDFVKEAVEEHKRTFNPEEIRDFIDTYIKELKKDVKGPSFDEKQMIALVGDMFTAGTETSSNLVTYAILFLCKYPQLQRCLHQRLDEVVGRGNLPNMDHRSKLVEIDAFLMETLRYRNPVLFAIPHYASKDTTIQGYFIQKGTRVNVNLNSVMMDDQHWGDARTFRPARFITEQGTLRRDERFIPFGKGKRACLGEALARMTTFLLFATLLHKLNFSFVESQEPSDEGVTGFTQSPESFNVILTERK
ncbi:Cytochrome P450 [Trinorchestia longiramus]|nr:Cytochrome P450 [Trinorchestia longiramus]